jgi:uncharacterized protein (DUF58 family)
VALPPAPRRGAALGDALPRGTRDFQPGDAPARLHAARTAQRGFPQVREYDTPSGRARLLRLWAPRAEAADVGLLLSCAASLGANWLASGEAVGLEAAGAPHLRLPVEPGAEQEQRLLRLLSSLESLDLDSASPPRGLGDAEHWLLTTQRDAPSPTGGRVLPIGPEAGPGAVLRLSELPSRLWGAQT